MPHELRLLFDSAWANLNDDGGSGFVGYAMAAIHTGILVTGDDLSRALHQGYHRVRTLTHLG